MTVSIAEHLDVLCPACGDSTATLIWMAVDFRAREDLRLAFQRGEGVMAACSACGELVLRDAPLVILGLADAAPAVLAFSPAREFNDGLAAADALIEQVVDVLREQRRALPTPLLYLPFDVLVMALARDVDRDVLAPDAAERSLAPVFGPEAAERYATFLGNIVTSEAERHLQAALGALNLVADVAGLEAVLREYPVLLSEEAREQRAAILEAARAQPAEGILGMPHDLGVRVATAGLELLERCAAGDIEGGWATYEAVLCEHMSFLDSMTSGLRGSMHDVFDSDLGRAAEIGEQLVATSRELGAASVEIEALYDTATAYFMRGDGDRGANIERGCELLNRAVALCDRYPDSVEHGLRVHILMNLGAGSGDRRRGDPAANLERAISLQRQALDLLSQEEDGSLRAIAHTNLGLNLLEREKFVSGADDDTTEAKRRAYAALSEAIDNFEQALTWRSFARDPLDWAYTQINLAVAHQRWRGEDRRAGLLRAIDHGGEAIRGFKAAQDAEVGAWALGNRAIARINLAVLHDTSRADRDDLLAAAEKDARTAIAMIGEDARGVDAGQRWRQLGEVLCAHGRYTPELLSTVRRALQELTPQTAPRDCRDAGRPFAALAADADEWAAAAEVWEQVAQGAAAAVESRATLAGRFNEIAENGTVFRWSAYALIRAGAPERAVEILELGRARQLSTWLQRDVVDLRPLQMADPKLCGRFVDLRHRIEAAERTEATFHDHAAARAFEDLAAIVDEVQQLPGLKGFLASPHVGELVGALREDETIAYPLTSPWGSAWVLIQGSANNAAQASVIDLPCLTSGAVFAALSRDYQPSDGAVVEGYLVEQMIAGDGLDDEIAHVASVLGPQLMEPLARAVRGPGYRSICIVAMGVLGLVPLHALTWEQDGADRCLLDEVDVAYAPSAYVRHVSRQRAGPRQEFKRLLAVGNPLPHTRPLRGAAHEAALVSAAVPAHDRKLLVGEAATKEAIMDSLPSASHVHLACHGRAAGDPFGFDSALSLDHDRAMSAKEILDIDLSGARLVVASACKTGVIPRSAHTADEVLALSSVFLAAGAAGVVASLWTVDDYGTSLLMARFYEELVATPDSPARALRAAQLWLRDLGSEQEMSFIVQHPTLDEQYRERRCAGNGSGGFEAPSMWAAFVFSGA